MTKRMVVMRGNANNLTPFKKGHKKLGGRKPGVPNKLTRDLKEAIVNAAESLGFDGRGLYGVTGYLMRLARDCPVAYAALIARVIPLQKPPEPPAFYGLDLLTAAELDELARLLRKSKLPVWAVQRFVDEDGQVRLQPTIYPEEHFEDVKDKK